MPEPALVITCEHAVNHVPPKYRPLFLGREEVLQTHRGYDPGALELARELSGVLGAPLFAGPITRLLADHNRSPGHPRLFSEFSRNLPSEEKRRLLEAHYLPFRRDVANWIASHLHAGRQVVHLAVHSFTPILDGKVRETDFGLLYDPQRMEEKALGRHWQRELRKKWDGWRVRLNYPYRGATDAHQTSYRRLYPPGRYLAVELEVNQALVEGPSWSRVQKAVVGSFEQALEER